MLDIKMSKEIAKDDGMCIAYAMESIFSFFNCQISIDQIWESCKEKRPFGNTAFFITTQSSVNYFNQKGIASTAVIVKSISSSMETLAKQNRTCISIMRWKKTTLGHAYVFLGLNKRGQYCFLDSDRPEDIRAFSTLELHDLAQRTSNEIVGNEVILVSNESSITEICRYCKSSFVVCDHALNDQIVNLLCTSCNKYN